jgi:hypothetical protein
MDLVDLLFLAGMGLYGLWGAVRWYWPTPPREPTERDRQLAQRMFEQAQRRVAQRLQRSAARQLARQRAVLRKGGRHGR